MTEDLREVSLLVTNGLSAVDRLCVEGMMSLGLNPYPSDYGTAFACSLIPYPQPRRLALRFTVPPQWCMGQENNGVTSFSFIGT